MTRLFKPGDRVILNSGGPVMEVLDYALEESPVIGTHVSGQKVRCVWFDPETGRRTGTFHQRSLRKAYGHLHTMPSKKAMPQYMS